MNNESEKKIITFPVWDLESNEIVEMYMDEDDYKAMVAAEDSIEKSRQERRQKLREEEKLSLRYVRSKD